MMKIDDRDRQDILDELQERARAYTPEWKFDTVQPDAAATIGLIFSHQMMENVNRRNQMWDKYHIEFANMCGLSRKPAIPARTICTVGVSDTIQDGVGLPAGTQVIGVTDVGEEVVFAFTEDLCAVNTKLTDIIETAEHFSVFPHQKKALRRQAVVMCFRHFSDLRRQSAALRFRGGDESFRMAELFADTAYFALSAALDGADLKSVCDADRKMLETAVNRDGELALVGSEPLPAVSVNGEEMTVLILEMKRPPAEKNGYQNIFVDGIEVCTACQSVRPDFMWNGMEEAASERFFLFGRQPALYDECLIGQDFLFDGKGACVSMRFRLEFERRCPHRATDTPTDLRIVRRKPKKDREGLQCECRVDEVSFTYFNGKGWRRLATDADRTTLFSREENAGEHQIRFVVPDDWERVEQGGYEGKCIRLQVVRADNCYLQEAEYIVPVVSDVVICMEECERGIAPDLAAVVRGKEVRAVRGRFCAFEQTWYQGDYVYWGFDHVFRQGFVSMFAELEKPAPPGLELSFAYSDGRMFKPLKMIDRTNAFQNSGMLQFAPPVDMAESEVDGVRRCWLRLQLCHSMYSVQGQPGREAQNHMPVVRKIHMNAVLAENSVAKDEQDYYIDAAAPDMRFPLYAENILSVQVWVNEKEQLTEEERNRLMTDARRDAALEVRAEYNFLGEIEDFYVLWHEVDSFGRAASMERCYCVDRGANELIFGDGVHVRIPQNTTSIAFKTRVVCCDGEKANIRAGSIDRFRGAVVAVEQVTNPVDAYGGTDLERLQRTLGRGSGVLSSRGRVVTEQDFVREALAFSDVVAQAACVTGEDGAVRIVLLMRDYQKGDYSFYRIQKPLQEHLLSRCETVCGNTLVQVCPPVFVRISIKVWLNVSEPSKSIEIRQRWMDRMTAFLEPVNGQGGIRWQIGRLPGTRQIRLMLGELERTAGIAHMDVLAQYFDGQRTVEQELDRVEASPFMVCCNGKHSVHMHTGV